MIYSRLQPLIKFKIQEYFGLLAISDIHVEQSEVTLVRGGEEPVNKDASKAEQEKVLLAAAEKSPQIHYPVHWVLKKKIETSDPAPLVRRRKIQFSRDV